MRLISRSMIMIVVATSVSACTAPDSAAIFTCAPNAPFPDPECLDAGTDAGGDAATEADSGPEASCPSRCLPAPSGGAGYWSQVPISVWIGPPEFMPAKCPDDPNGAPNEQFRLFAELVAPPAACEPCDCAPSKGTCVPPPAGLPESITIRAGICGQSGVETRPFDGPVGWDGSCTSANALPAGEKCPTGSSTLCAQSVYASKLPGPVEEGCTPTSSAPAFTVETRWNLGALACSAAASPYRCENDADGEVCVNDPGQEWDQCVYRVGVHAKCPANYSFGRYVMYPEKPLDSRGCTACECGAPVGSGCLGTLRLYDDAACSKQFTEQVVGSFQEQCGNIIAPGRAIAAKALTDLSYVPGICAAMGGEPTGTASEDADPEIAVTFCCLHPFYDLK